MAELSVGFASDNGNVLALSAGEKGDPVAVLLAGHQVMLTNDDRQELITFLAECTINPPCLLGCR